MAKANYSKVEDAFDEGLRKLLVEKLLESAGPALPRTSERPETLLEIESTAEKREKEVRVQTLLGILRELKLVHKLDKDIYRTLKLSPKKMRYYVENPESLTPKEWEAVKSLKNRVEARHKDLLSKLPGKSDEELIAEQRTSQQTKRHKVNPAWLPLHRLNP